jgi:hypothetical protein
VDHVCENIENTGRIDGYCIGRLKNFSAEPLKIQVAYSFEILMSWTTGRMPLASNHIPFSGNVSWKPLALVKMPRIIG